MYLGSYGLNNKKQAKKETHESLKGKPGAFRKIYKHTQNWQVAKSPA